MMVNDKHYENEISSLVTEKLEQTSDVLPVWRNLAALTYKKKLLLKRYCAPNLFTAERT